jgi:hypothetical protein
MHGKSDEGRVEDESKDDKRSSDEMRIEDRSGESLSEATVSVDDEELMDLLQGLADVIEGQREHLHFAQPGGPQLVFRRAAEGDPDPLGRQMDWWLGPLVLLGALLIVIGAATLIRWAAGLLS